MELQALLFRGILWRGIYLVIFFAVNVLLARTLEADGSGEFFFDINFYSLCLLLLSLSAESAVSYFASNKKIKDHQLSYFSLVWSFIAGAVLFVYLFLIPHPAYEIGLMKDGFAWFGFLYVSGILLINFFTGLFYAQKNYFIPNFLLSILNLLLIIGIVCYADDKPAIVQIYFVAFLLQGLVLCFAYLFSNGFVLPQLPVINDLKKIFRYALVALSGNIVFFLVYKLDYWFVEYYCSKHDLGNYIQVSKLSQMLLIIPQIFSSVIFPQTARGEDRHETRDTLLILIRLLTIAYLLILILVSIAGKFLFPWIFGATFNNMYVPMLIMLPGIWALSAMVLLAAYFSGKGYPKINTYGGLISVVVVIAGNYFLTKQYGIYAAAFVSSVAYFAYFFFLARKFMSQYQIGLDSFFMMKKSDLQWLISMVGIKTKQ